MESACPDLDLVRQTLKAARKALETGRRIEALAAEDDAGVAIIIAAGTQRELRPALEALTVSAEMLIAARADGYRQGASDGAAEAERRLAESEPGRPPPLRAAGHG